MDSEEYDKYLANLDDEEKEVLNSGLNYYQIDLSSPGGLVMPVILELEFVDGTKEKQYIPAESIYLKFSFS